MVDTLPLPEFVIALGNLYGITGRTNDARHEYDLVGAIQQLYESAGVDIEMEFALFNSDHRIDLARSAYQHRLSVYAADTLAWKLYRNSQ